MKNGSKRIALLEFPGTLLRRCTVDQAGRKVKLAAELDLSGIDTDRFMQRLVPTLQAAADAAGAYDPVLVRGVLPRAKKTPKRKKQAAEA